MSLQRAWEGKEWERFTRLLIRLRHGAQNVQNVPDDVQGDAGIECFTVDGCCYQSYAPEETADVAKASSAMKQKATRDLPKLIKNREKIESLVGPIKIKRWILLCPFLDDKEVIAHVRKKEAEILGANLPFLAPEFRAMVHCQIDFEHEIALLRQGHSGLPLKIAMASDAEVSGVTNEIHERVRGKLKRAFPGAAEEQISQQTRAFIKSELTGSNALELLKQDYPDLWERSRKTIDVEAQRLALVSAGHAQPSEQLRQGLQRLESGLGKDLPSLSHADVTAIASGVVGTWLIECPLDFPEVTK